MTASRDSGLRHPVCVFHNPGLRCCGRLRFIVILRCSSVVVAVIIFGA